MQQTDHNDETTGKEETYIKEFIEKEALWNNHSEPESSEGYIIIFAANLRSSSDNYNITAKVTDHILPFFELYWS